MDSPEYEAGGGKVQNNEGGIHFLSNVAFFLFFYGLKNEIFLRQGAGGVFTWFLYSHVLGYSHGS